MKISDYFIIMPPQQLLDRYASSRIPIAMFTTIDGSADLGINQTATKWGPNDIDILLDFYKASIANLYSQIDFIQSKIIKVNERQFIVFEFLGELTEESLLGEVNSIKKYNIKQACLLAVVDGQDCHWRAMCMENTGVIRLSPIGRI